MGALLALPVSLLNLLLPFTKPGTPIAQDLIHTAVLCGTLYFAPQIAEWYHRRHQDTATNGPAGNEDIHQPGMRPNQEQLIAQREEPPLDERLVLQPSDDEDEPNPPPHAPTPPFATQNAQAPPLPQPHDADPFAAGPANPNPNALRPTPANRTVGAKKAELAAERERRARIEAAIAAKAREERQKRKEEERREADEENERRERVVTRVRREVTQRACVDLLEEGRREGKDRMWVVRLVKASGLMAQLSMQGSKVMITGDGWLVRVDEDIMAQAYRDAEAFGAKNGGRVGFDDLGGFMERAVRARAKV
ncbi:hypothetical protein BDU57DRAFT_297393 [Ampelomyces quisqualis]|uniref:Uncharacterized protein n=1 Tax=Ampelomyces quisqualis TaxID=50730 RepID=A0A6A5QGB6_AMPQU|nr:hypothetical protein BDU57DRAFT_297393 [Ampelomyces quisqualis]